MAVEKYMKKKERQKIAESNRLTREKTSADLENETKAILDKLQSVDISKEKEMSELHLEKYVRRRNLGKHKRKRSY